MKKYWMLCLEPVHIGTGEYRLGRVDNSILREPATGIPIIPATTVAGIFRAFSGVENPDEVYGSPNKESSVVFSDARVAFFPVLSSKGPVWITTTERLGQVGVEVDIATGDDRAHLLRVGNGNAADKEDIALGWLFLKTSDDSTEIPDSSLFGIIPDDSAIYALSDKLFYHIVNDNLEVRTSVRIDKETGTADKGGLFTSESLPRGTVLLTEIHERDGAGVKLGNLIDSVNAHLRITGLGGMRSRGYGRISISEVV